jgi:hypothetical protein
LWGENQEQSNHREGLGKYHSTVAPHIHYVRELDRNFLDHNQDQVAVAHDKLLEHRREALFSALKVVDLAYSNQTWNKHLAAHNSLIVASKDSIHF